MHCTPEFVDFPVETAVDTAVDTVVVVVVAVAAVGKQSFAFPSISTSYLPTDPPSSTFHETRQSSY